MIKKLLELRNKKKSIMPKFRTHDSHKKKRVSSTTWRRPKGRQNKMRLGMKGYARSRSTGFSSPQLVKGLSRNGLTQNLIYTITDFENLDNKIDGVIIASQTGKLKKKKLIDFAVEKGFTILNLDVEKFNSNYNQFIENKKNAKVELNKRKETKEKKAKEAKKKDDKKEEKKTEKKPVTLKENKVETAKPEIKKEVQAEKPATESQSSDKGSPKASSQSADDGEVEK